MKILGELRGPVDFVAMGHLAVDLRNGEPTLGGAAAYGCLAAARLGRATAMVTAVGEDFGFFGSLHGIEIHYHPSRESTTFRNQYRGSERMQHLLGRARRLAQADLAPLMAKLADGATILYCPIAQEIEAPLIPLEPGSPCGVAPQGFFRSWNDDGEIQRCAWPGATAALAETTFVSMSASDTSQPRELALEWASETRTLAVTEGERGARVYTRGRCFRVPALEHRSVDPTGAGDVFAASFLVALAEGQAPLEAAQFATCAASYTVEATGVAGVFSNRGMVEARLAAYRDRYRPEEVDP